MSSDDCSGLSKYEDKAQGAFVTSRQEKTKYFYNLRDTKRHKP